MVQLQEDMILTKNKHAEINSTIIKANADYVRSLNSTKATIFNLQQTKDELQYQLAEARAALSAKDVQNAILQVSDLKMQCEPTVNSTLAPKRLNIKRVYITRIKFTRFWRQSYRRILLWNRTLIPGNMSIHLLPLFNQNLTSVTSLWYT